MQMVIFCGGLATRLGEVAKDTPKSMILIEGRPFLEHQINFLKLSGVTDIVLCVNHLAEKIEDYFEDGERFGVNLRYSYDGDTPLGPIGALKKAEPLLDNIFFMMYGDSYVFVDFQRVYSFFLNKESLALMTVYKNNDNIDASNLVVKDGLITRVGKEPKTSDLEYIDYGTTGDSSYRTLDFAFPIPLKVAAGDVVTMKISVVSGPQSPVIQVLSVEYIELPF